MLGILESFWLIHKNGSKLPPLLWKNSTLNLVTISNDSDSKRLSHRVFEKLKFNLFPFIQPFVFTGIWVTYRWCGLWKRSEVLNTFTSPLDTFTWYWGTWRKLKLVSFYCTWVHVYYNVVAVGVGMLSEIGQAWNSDRHAHWCHAVGASSEFS